MDLDEIYKKMPQIDIPWNIEEPPQALVELVEGGSVRPCKAIDFGCGAGNYAIYLAGKGFDVTGIDISPTAIRIAEENARQKGVRCRFLTADVLGGLEEIQETFDFAFDWELLHHIFPENRTTYVRNVYRKLSSKGSYLSVCFSEKDPQFGGSGKYRKTRLDTLLYFSSEAELRELFSPYFIIEDLRTIQISGKHLSHIVVYVFMKKK
jgi:cyclopropane fatty-acyl-phospholipid synthase-like methyltransferase